MLVTLPKFSRGLKLVRIGVLIMLLQLVLAIVMAVKAFGADTQEEARDALKWTQYLFLANIAAGLAMLVGVAQAIPELKRAGVSTGKLVAATIGFAITTAAVAWTYHVLSNFVDIALHLDSHDMNDLRKAAEDLKMLPYVSFCKDVGYWIGLISLISMVRRSAIANDQLALRDLAGSMNRALLVMFLGDLFFQFTYGVGSGGAGMFGVIGGLLVLGFWIYCHVRLQRFLYNAAYLMNEPHNLPIATVLSGGDKPAKKSAVARGTPPAAPRTSQPNVAARVSQPNVVAPAPRPSQPEAPAATTPRPPFELPQRPSQQAAPPPPAPRPASNAEAEPTAGEPRFLR